MEEQKPFVYLFENRKEAADEIFAACSKDFKIIRILDGAELPQISQNALFLVGETAPGRLADIAMPASEGGKKPFVMLINSESPNKAEKAMVLSPGINLEKDTFMQEPSKFLFLAKWMAELSKRESLPSMTESMLGEIRGKRILIVDDNELMRKLAVSCAKINGLSASEAVNGKEGLQLFEEALKRNEPFDAVLTDQLMPKMTGSEMAEKIKSLSPSTPMIKMTGNDPEGNDKDFAAVICKPFGIFDICGLMAAVLIRGELLKMKELATGMKVGARTMLPPNGAVPSGMPPKARLPI